MDWLRGLVERSALGSAEQTTLWKKMGMLLSLATRTQLFEGISSGRFLLENRLSLDEEVVCWLSSYGEVW